MNMVKKFVKYPWDRKSQDNRPTRVGDGIYELLRKMGSHRGQDRLADLWRNWPDAVGEELAWINHGGHKDDVLFLVAGDAMEMQEISMYAPQILERVNAWLGTEYFSRLRMILRPEQA